MKTCVLCKIEKDEGGFNKQSRSRDGLQRYCRACQKIKNKSWMVQNKDHRKAYEESYKELNREETKKLKRLWDERNFDHRRNYRLSRKEYYAERGSYRYLLQKSATPPWLTEEQLREIKNFYWLAEDLFKVSGQKYNVDHIIPVQGENVCGLHVPWNLQVLPKDINISKGNRLDT